VLNKIRSGLRFVHKKLLRDTLGVTQHQNIVNNVAPLLDADAATAVDIGCGDGIFSSLLAKARPGLKILGVEIRARPGCRIECITYDGVTLPFPDKSYDYALLINMLHHCDDPSRVLDEAKRVARRGVIIKDHYANNRFDFCNLVLMEWIGNAFTGINQPYGFVSEPGWKDVFQKHGLVVEKLVTRFVSYNRFLDIFFGRNLHFIARVKQA
jgi:SAM-dependent methyltransferase